MILEALKARNEVTVSTRARPTPWFHFAPSALDGLLGTPPGALPQAITFRAFGAFKPMTQRTVAGN
jgi:hypothetical protein